MNPLWEYSWQIIVCLLLTTGLRFFQPLIMRMVTDDGLIGGNLSILIWSVLALLGLALFEQGMEIMLTRVFAEVHNKTYSNIYSKVFSKLFKLRMDYYADKEQAQLINHIQTDVSNVASITDRQVAMIASSIFQAISGIAGLLIISWQLTLVVIGLIPLQLYLVMHFSKQKEKMTEDMIEKMGTFYGWFGDNINGIREIKLWGLFKLRSSVFHEKMSTMLQITKDNTMLDAWSSFWQNSLHWLSTGLLYVLGGLLVVRGKLSIGSAFAFISYSSFVTGPIAFVFGLRYYLSQLLPSAKRLFSFMDLKEESAEASLMPSSINGVTLEFHDIWFAYDENGRETKPVLQGANFQVEEGQKIAIIGANGSGKTTLLHLLLRFLEPKSGAILLNGINAEKIALDSYRQLFSVVSQDPYLFNDTVRMNIDPQQKASAERIEQALRQSGAKSFISRLPNGLDSRIGHNGAWLSGGEKQKLAVARALILDTPIVILDEATSGYDVESDAYLHNVLLHEFSGKTILMVTHRYTNLDGIDIVLRLENGRLSRV